MKALVTGAAGFVGRHMVRELCSRGWEVDGVDVHDHVGDPTADGGWYAHSTGDVLEAFRADWAVKRYDLVVHAAAAEPHRAAIDSKPMLLASNLELDAAMFRWAVRTQQRRVLYLSSSAAYPVELQAAWRKRRLREDDADPDECLSDRLDPVSPEPADHYGWTKLTGERMAAAADTAGVPTHVVRTFSGYGEDQAEAFPFRAFVERARRREDPFTIWGSADQVRDFIHIDDVVAGALAVVDADERRPVNLCTGVGASMRDFALLCAHTAGYEPALKVDAGAPLGVAYRVGDPTRMNEHYTAKVSLEEGIARALAG